MPHNDDSYDIVGKIKDNTYFQDSMQWYAKKYIAPIHERTILALLSLFSIFLLLKILFNTNILTVETFNIKYSTNNADYSKQYPTISKLSHDSKDPQYYVAKYLLTKYLLTREEYYPKQYNESNIKNIIKYIKSSSNKIVAKNFISYISPSNIYSPIYRYKDTIQRYININDFTFLNNNPFSGKTTISFTATEKNIKTEEEISTTKWQLNINYLLSDIKKIQKNNSPIKFLVTNYQLTQI